MGIGYRSTNLDGLDEIYLRNNTQNRWRKKCLEPTSNCDKKIQKIFQNNLVGLSITSVEVAGDKGLIGSGPSLIMGTPDNININREKNHARKNYLIDERWKISQTKKSQLSRTLALIPYYSIGRRNIRDFGGIGHIPIEDQSTVQFYTIIVPNHRL